MGLGLGQLGQGDPLGAYFYSDIKSKTNIYIKMTIFGLFVFKRKLKVCKVDRFFFFPNLNLFCYGVNFIINCQDLVTDFHSYRPALGFPAPEGRLPFVP